MMEILIVYMCFVLGSGARIMQKNYSPQKKRALNSPIAEAEAFGDLF